MFLDDEERLRYSSSSLNPVIVSVVIVTLFNSKPVIINKKGIIYFNFGKELL